MCNHTCRACLHPCLAGYMPAKLLVQLKSQMDSRAATAAAAAAVQARSKQALLSPKTQARLSMKLKLWRTSWPRLWTRAQPRLRVGSLLYGGVWFNIQGKTRGGFPVISPAVYPDGCRECTQSVQEMQMCAKGMITPSVIPPHMGAVEKVVLNRACKELITMLACSSCSVPCLYLANELLEEALCVDKDELPHTVKACSSVHMLPLRQQALATGR